MGCTTNFTKGKIEDALIVKLGLDTDNDMLTDSYESLYGIDPTNSDTDGDGFSDGEEISAGTDPLDPNDYPMMHTTNTPEDVFGHVLPIVVVSVIAAVSVVLLLAVRKRTR